jgi:superfamily I DNA/RNA helicase
VLDSLNVQQRRAVQAPFSRHCLILAGAGCGKTAVLTRRIAWCAAHHCEQRRILALTFTRKAAAEMRQRAVDLDGIHEELPLPRITTFHGLCRAIALETIEGTPNYARLGYHQRPRLLMERERLEMLAAVSSSRERRVLDADLYRLDSLLACHAVNRSRLRALSESRQALLDRIARRLTHYKREHGAWEFADMTACAVRLLETVPAAAREIQRRFACVLVDEFQDTNPLQIALLKLLCGAHAPVFAVGDDDQAIYGFRGADTGPVLRFGDYFPDAACMKLEINYRSRPALLRRTNRIFADKPAPLRKVLRSGAFAGRGERGRGPIRRCFADYDVMIRWVSRTIDTSCARLGRDPDAIAVLFRLHDTADSFREALGACRGGRAMPRIMTVHASKGLEFDAVIVCDLEEGIFPHYRGRPQRPIRTWRDVWRGLASGSPRRSAPADCDLEEERRLFYVAATRARSQLFLVAVRKKRLHNTFTALRPSRFLSLL